MTAPVPPDANGLRGVEAMARAMYETGLLNLPLSDSLDIDCHDAARAALAVLAASEAAPTPGERHVVHVTETPIAEDVVWCEECEEWVTSGEPGRPATPPADDATPSERDGWSRCTKTMFGRCNDGRMEPWRGSDGHGGTEWFSTCDRCGVTS